jgi:aryl-alcohol dehydrogenase-like predicted oxidoreductase
VGAFGGGLLTGKYRNNEQGRLTSQAAISQQEDTAQKSAIIDTLLDVAKDAGTKPAQVAVAWLRQSARRWPTAVVPVIGPRTLGQLEDYLAALELELSPERFAALDAVSAPALGYPGTTIEKYADGALGGASARFDPVRPVA